MIYAHVSRASEDDMADLQAVPAADAINPSHYRQGGIEAIDALEASMTRDEHIGYLKGQVMRYLWRLGRKDDPVQEAGKALWYAERLKKFLEQTATSQRGMADGDRGE